MNVDAYQKDDFVLFNPVKDENASSLVEPEPLIGRITHVDSEQRSFHYQLLAFPRTVLSEVQPYRSRYELIKTQN